MPREPSWWYAERGLAAAALAPVAAFYGHIAAGRLTRPGYRSSLPVVCVGNLTAGGTGKTPFTIALVERLIARGKQPAILTRGYGGRVRGPHWVDARADRAALVGDEPLLCARAAPTMVCADRAVGARAIEMRGAIDVIVMDDGLQNPTLAKSVTFAIVDGTRGLGNGSVIPAGPLRAPVERQIGIIDAVVVNGPCSGEVSRQLAPLSRLPRVHCALVAADNRAELTGLRVVAFAGIGHPDRFFATLESLGAEVVARIPFPDHGVVSANEARRLLETAHSQGATLMTTEKDHVRMVGEPALAALLTATGVLRVTMAMGDADWRAVDTLLDRALS